MTRAFFFIPKIGSGSCDLEYERKKNHFNEHYAVLWGVKVG